MGVFKFTIPFILALSLSGCQPNEAESLYRNAVLKEQANGGLSFATVDAYRQVIRAAPNSAWAEKSQRRIDVIEQHLAARREAFGAQLRAQIADQRADIADQEAAREARRIRQALERRDSFR